MKSFHFGLINWISSMKTLVLSSNYLLACSWVTKLTMKLVECGYKEHDIVHMSSLIVLSLQYIGSHILRYLYAWIPDFQESSPNCEKEPCAGGNPENRRVIQWLRNLGLSKYEEIFIREEVDWETLQWLTEEVRLVVLFRWRSLVKFESITA